MSVLNKNENVGLKDLLDRVMGLKREDVACPCASASIDDVMLKIRFGSGNPLGSVVNREPFIYMRQGSEVKFSYRLTQHALEQLNARYSGLSALGGTADHYMARHVYLNAVNGLLQADARKMTIRTIQPNGRRIARAVVSDAFKPIDDNLLMPSIIEQFAQGADRWSTLGGQVTETKTYLNFVSRAPIATVHDNGKERKIYAAIRYSNSEVGAGTTSFTAGFIDGYCMNGCWFSSMIVADCNFTHRGSRIQTAFGHIFDERIQQAELLNIKSVVADASRIAIAGAFIPEIANLVAASQSKKIGDVDKAKFIRLIGEKVGLTKLEAENSLMHVEGSTSAFGIQQAITRLAQDADGYDDRMRLETAGGAVLTMPDRIWASIEALAR